MSLTTKQEHVTTTYALCMISKRHKQRWFHSASPRPCLEFSLSCLGLELSASALPQLRTLLPCLTSASTSLPRPLPWQNCLEPIPDQKPFVVKQRMEDPKWALGQLVHRMSRFLPEVLGHCWFGNRKSNHPVSWVLVCWWWQSDWCFACLVTTTSCAAIKSRKVVPAYLGCPGKWPLNECSCCCRL